ncbi:MAG TPA: alpha-galactosidase, partial [Microbacterium sp.]|nr:alpha-galactosidase [Microbacterium sp.]
MTALFALERDGVGLVVDARGDALPRILHWGDALGPLRTTDLEAVADAVGRQSAPGTLDAPVQLNLLPAEADGWSGRPGLQLRRDGRLHHPRWTLENVSSTVDTVDVIARDDSS